MGTETDASPSSTTFPRQTGQSPRPTVGSQPAPGRAVARVHRVAAAGRVAATGRVAPARTGDAGPRLRQLMGVCGWAAILGGVGLVLGIRGLVGVIADDPPGWYEPSTITAGLLWLALTIGSFLTVRRAKAPWVLLSGASVSLAVAMVFTSVAF